MTRTAPRQISFASGEIDPLLHWRDDYARARDGLSLCRGFLPLPQGGLTRAPGTFMRGEIKSGATQAVLIPFIFAQNDACVLELTPLEMRVWRYGSLVTAANGSVYSRATPWTAADLANLQWVQSADVIYVADGRNPIQRLARLALNNWTLDDLELSRGPFRAQNLTKSQTLQASAGTGSITLTASFSYFTNAHVGSLIRLRPTDNTDVPLWTSNEALTVGDRRRYGQNVYELTVGTNAGENPPVHPEGTAATDNSTQWRFIADDEGIVRITARTSATVATATVIKRVPPGCVSNPTHRWSEGAWSALHGYPGALEIYDQRLVAAATPSQPRTLWFSAVGAYDDFLDGTAADQSFAYTIAGNGSVNRVLNLKTTRYGLCIFALGEEYITRSESRDVVIGPTTAVFDAVGTNGSNGARPIAPDGDPIFISGDGSRVMVLGYDLQSDGTRALRLSTPAEHLSRQGVQQIVWQSAPLPIAWMRRSAGDLLAMVYDPAEDVLGWASVPLAGGECLSIAVTPSETQRRDVVTMAVRRSTPAGPVIFVEEMAPIFALGTQALAARACHLFCAVETGDVGGSQGTRLFDTVPHLAGQTVHAWTDLGAYMDIEADANGVVNYPAAVQGAIVGLYDATHEARTLDVPAATPNGSSIGRLKRLKGTAVIVRRTSQGFLQAEHVLIRGRDSDMRSTIDYDLFQLIPDSSRNEFNDLRSGILKLPVITDKAYEVRLRILPFSGAPLTVLGLVPTIEEAGE